MQDEHENIHSDIYLSIYNLIGIINQAIKQIEGLQNIVSEQQKIAGIQQESLDKFFKNSNIIPLQAVFTFKKTHPDIKINAPKQKKDMIFWLPVSGDCNSKEAQN